MGYTPPRMEQLVPRERIEVKDNSHYGSHIERVGTFPETHRCDDCGGFSGVTTLDGSEIQEPMLAYQIALVRYGHENITSARKMVEGRAFRPPEDGPCSCHEPAPVLDTPLSEVVEFLDDGRIRFPTLCACHQCGGYREAFRRGNGWVAAYISLVSDGLHMRHWDNALHEVKGCDCDTELLRLKKEIENLPEIVKDSGWEGESGGRCITDYTRIVSFARPLTEDELQLWLAYLRRDKCPGWTGISAREIRTSEYIFHTTWDSSD